MYAVLVGGMDRLQRSYIETAKSLGVALKVFSGRERNVGKQLGGADMLILCTGKVSHSARRKVIKHAGAKQIPVQMMHSAGVSALRCCIADCPLWSSVQKFKWRLHKKQGDPQYMQMTMRWFETSYDSVTLVQIWEAITKQEIYTL